LASQDVDHRAVISVRENSHYDIDVFIGEERCTTPSLSKSTRLWTKMGALF